MSAVALADDDESPARVSVVQRRQYTMRHEIQVSGGFLPLDAFYKGITANVGYTYHFNDHFAWRVVRGAYEKNFDTGLKRQLMQQFGVLTTDFPEVQWLAGSDLIWNAFYGKTAFMNAFVLHLALFLELGADAVKTQTDIMPAVNFGGGLRFFATEWLSVKVEASNHFVLGKKSFNIVDLQLALAVNLGS
ncbi:MAG: outer membrane beta-barrel domain-containing protein [Archangiaceae bacterium]|nr:outer membrane beta-barrel domain-containing protein [Archangiaceae bacterium]